MSELVNLNRGLVSLNNGLETFPVSPTKMASDVAACATATRIRNSLVVLPAVLPPVSINLDVYCHRSCRVLKNIEANRWPARGISVPLTRLVYLSSNVVLPLVQAKQYTP